MDDVVVHYMIPGPLEKRFAWLSAGDSRVKQQLLNHCQQYEKAHVVEGARLRVPVLLDHLRGNAGSNTYRLAEVLKIGNHELELTIDRHTSGVRVTDPYVAPPRAAPTQYETTSTSYGWVFWVLAAIFVLFLLSHR